MQPIEAGVDGEALQFDSPLRFEIVPAALRVRVAPHHPGYSPAALAESVRRGGIRRLVGVAVGRDPGGPRSCPTTSRDRPWTSGRRAPTTDAPTPTSAVVPWTRPEPPAIGVTGFLRRATDLGLGAASIADVGRGRRDRAVRTRRAGRRRTTRSRRPAWSGSSPARSWAPASSRSAACSTCRRASSAASPQVAGTLRRTPFVGAPVRATEDYLERWSDLGEVEQARNRALVTEFVRRLAPELATAVIAQLDMDALMSQLPIDSIVAKVDIDALLDNVNVEGIIDRVDVEKIIDRVDVEKIIDRVDVEKIIDR